MIPQELYNKIKTQFESKFHFPEDKPEETVDSTLKACWFTASGTPMSADEATKHPLPILTEKQTKILYHLLEQRLNNVPLAHLTGRQNFMEIELLSDKRALIPRKETEILGRKALELSSKMAKEKETVRAMDICCGSGNLGLALAHSNPKVIVYATDLSEEAVNLTRDNISFLNLRDRVQAEQGDLFSAFESPEYYKNIDLIICNPPYISSAKVKKMDIEISAHEPLLAFDGGMFGFKIVQKLIEEAPKFLTKAGWLIFEVGAGQGEFIMRLCESTNKYSQIESVSDERGNIRVILTQKV
ncbi:MAG TPA: peptide chain release factor N(5)-glutamine methyltransferase [Chitinophagaceae bacterium]|nr:peptide chain release factor N(5)-glutamine methyltransferase [Chitinophagaceae bacterium]